MKGLEWERHLTVDQWTPYKADRGIVEGRDEKTTTHPKDSADDDTPDTIPVKNIVSLPSNFFLQDKDKCMSNYCNGLMDPHTLLLSAFQSRLVRPKRQLLSQSDHQKQHTLSTISCMYIRAKYNPTMVHGMNPDSLWWRMRFEWCWVTHAINVTSAESMIMHYTHGVPMKSAGPINT